MRTSEDVGQSGRYASECCGRQLNFIKGATFWRCPQCQRLCDWELVQAAVSTGDLEDPELAEITVKSAHAVNGRHSVRRVIPA